MNSPPLRDFLEIPYEQLAEMNLEAKEQRKSRAAFGEIEDGRRKYLAEEKRIKAVTVCFSDVEGRMHTLDYDKKFLLRSADNLTFDGSSIKGFTVQQESDLRLNIDWPAFYWLPSDIFGPGKVLVFADVMTRDGAPYHADTRGMLKTYEKNLYDKDKTEAHVAAEIEGFLFKGVEAERHYCRAREFEFVTEGGYYHSLPQDPLRSFIDTAAEVQRAMGFGNEKDHPEVAPSQFEMNWSYELASIAADQIQLYKLACRRVAHHYDATACFLPKPLTGINGNGMHTNISLCRNEKNIFHDGNGADGLSTLAWEFIDRILHAASDICLVLNPSVNAYRRLDPEYEAPNQIKASAVNRASMIRIPLANERSARVEVRSISPDVNPYLLIFTLLKTGLEGETPPPDDTEKRSRTRFLPDNIYDAMRNFKASKWTTRLMGEELQAKYAESKQVSADRCPRALGEIIKRSEVQFHHEVTNQSLWKNF